MLGEVTSFIVYVKSSVVFIVPSLTLILIL
ncbi:hypothetical protein ES703_38533 [subsurface metagenome]